MMKSKVSFSYLCSSIGKKQIIATTGLFLILFVVAHLAGNLTFYCGPSAFNGYAEKLKKMRPLLNIFEYGLLVVFLIHNFFTFWLILERRKFRKNKYLVPAKVKKAQLSASLMKITGPIILVYIILHLWDFTFKDHSGIQSYVHGEFLGLYGLVFNSFSSIFRSVWYVFAMVAVGLHLDHGFQSFFQTFGLSNQNNLKNIGIFSRIFAVVITIAYASIPLYVLFLNYYFSFKNFYSQGIN